MKKYFKYLIFLIVITASLYISEKTAVAGSYRCGTSLAPVIGNMNDAPWPSSNDIFSTDETIYFNFQATTDVYIKSATLRIYRNGSLYNTWTASIGNYIRYASYPYSLPVGNYTYAWAVTYSDSPNGGVVSDSWEGSLSVPSVSASSSAISLDLNGSYSRTLNITADYSANGGYSASYSISNNSVFSASWGDWNGEIIPIKITASKTGAATITISLKRASDNKVLGITVITIAVIDSTPVYTVTYNANGGSGAPSSQIKYHGKSLTLSSSKPSRNGYEFLGWSTSSAAITVSYYTGGTYTGNSDITLYAVWKAEEYIVTYNANGGSGAPSSQTKYHGKSLTLSNSKPSRNGYEFLGWSTSSTAITASYYAGGTYTGNSDITLYAVWKKIEDKSIETPKPTYTISYNANGGSGAPSSQTKSHGLDLILSSMKPTKESYEFLGWSENNSAVTASYYAGGIYTNNSNATLYAVWKVVENKNDEISTPTPIYTITYNGNGGSGTPSSQTKYYGKDLVLSSIIPVRAGYEFLGWSIYRLATAVSYYVGDIYNLDSNITLYAVWRQIDEEQFPSASLEPDMNDIISTITPSPTPAVNNTWDNIVPTATPGIKPTATPKPSGNTNSNSVSTENNKISQNIIASSITKEYGGSSFYLNAYTTGNGKLSYEAESENVVRIGWNGEVEIMGYGEVGVTISASETDKYWSTREIITIKIVPKKPTIKKVSSTSTGRLMCSWKKDKSVSGYEVKISGGGKNTTFSCKKSSVNGLAKSKKTYKVKIRSYKKVGTKKYYSKWSKTKKVKVK